MHILLGQPLVLALLYDRPGTGQYEPTVMSVEECNQRFDGSTLNDSNAIKTFTRSKNDSRGRHRKCIKTEDVRKKWPSTSASASWPSDGGCMK